MPTNEHFDYQHNQYAAANKKSLPLVPANYVMYATYICITHISE